LRKNIVLQGFAKLSGGLLGWAVKVFSSLDCWVSSCISGLQAQVGGEEWRVDTVIRLAMVGWGGGKRGVGETGGRGCQV
jgi:hypothetical protein